jgi:L-asparaginase
MTMGLDQMNFGHLRRISDTVAGLVARKTDPIDGVAITRGTDATEETAILRDLVHDDPRPVVLTGAQQASDVADCDGPGTSQMPRLSRRLQALVE